MTHEELIKQVYEQYNADSEKGLHYPIDYEADLNQALGRLILGESEAVEFLEQFLKREKRVDREQIMEFFRDRNNTYDLSEDDIKEIVMECLSFNDALHDAFCGLWRLWDEG